MVIDVYRSQENPLSSGGLRKHITRLSSQINYALGCSVARPRGPSGSTSEYRRGHSWAHTDRQPLLAIARTGPRERADARATRSACPPLSPHQATHRPPRAQRPLVKAAKCCGSNV